MKKTINIILCLLALAVVAGCSKAQDTKTKSPKIGIRLVNEVPATVYPGDTVDFEFELKYSKGLAFSFATADGEELEDTRTVYPDSTTTASVVFSYVPQDVYAGNSIDFAVAALANDGAEGHYDVPVFVLAAKSKISVKIPEDAPDSFEVKGTALQFDVVITSANVDMKHISVYKGEKIMEDMSYDVKGNLRQQTLKFSYTPTLGDTGGSTVFTFEVMDVNGNLTDVYYSVAFYKAPSLELKEYTGVIMGMNKCTAAGQFMNLYSNQVYVAAGVGAKCATVDLAVFWSNNAGTAGSAFASPHVYNVTSIYSEAAITNLGGTTEDVPANWKVRNQTSFRDLSIDADTYAAVDTKAAVIALYNNGTKPASDYVTFQKNKGSVMAFCASRLKLDPETGEPVVNPETGEKEIESSRYGLIRVTARQATNNTGTITFDYKIEK